MSDIKYALYTSSKGFKVVGGTAAQFLKADGSVDSAGYIPVNTEINMGDKNINFTTGSLSRFENDSRVFNKVFQKMTYPAQTGIFSIKFPQATISATMFDVTLKIYGYQDKLLGNLRISFYKISDIAINPNGAKALLEISDNFPTRVINVGIDATGRVCINIGEPTTFWNTYVAVEVERVAVHYTGRTADWSKGWSQTMETDTTNYQSILNIVPDVVATRAWVDQNNIGSIPKSPALIGTADLNAMVTPGFYYQHANGNAITASNYPSEGLFAGSLRVYKTFSTGLVQEYQTRTSGGTVTFIRSTENNGASWTEWKKVLTSTDFNPANYFTKSESLSQFVGKSGNETISGTKTFTNSPVVPNASSNGHAVNYGQMDSLLNATLSGFVPLGLLGVFNGVATLDNGGKVPASQLPFASDSTFGTVKLGSNVFVSGASSPSPEVAGRIYPVMQNSQNQLVVVVPWTSSTYTHPNSGVTAGTYRSVTVNAQGHVTGGTNPTTLAGYGITDAMSTSHPASNINQIWINTWNDIANNGIRLNQEFTYNLGTGLVIADDYFGGDSGIVDRNQERFLAVKRSEYYIYGSRHDEFDGLNYHTEQRVFGMGREANGKDKLTVEGSVKASKNFKSEYEEPNKIFIPDGNTASLTDEIINDQPEYAVRLDPHEYYVSAGNTLKVEDRNRLIHIIGQETKMAVDFMKIHPKQQVVIYNFDKAGGTMPVMIMGKVIANISPSCFVRFYVTKSLNVITEREQSCKFF